jgi:hypothetical protein
VSVPSFAIPTRKEYRLATGLPGRVKDDIRAFRPTLFHLSARTCSAAAPGFRRGAGRAGDRQPHTLFQTYLDYYGLAFLRPMGERYLDRFYARCDYVLAPTEPLAEDVRRAPGSEITSASGAAASITISGPRPSATSIGAAARALRTTRRFCSSSAGW